MSLAPLRSESAEHVRALHDALCTLSDAALERVEQWGIELAAVLCGGGRLLAAGNGGSAAQAEHLTGELVGRYRCERRPLSAIPLHVDTASLTAIGNDYGADTAYARAVNAHGREGDVLVALSTSGRSTNVLRAVEAAHLCGLRTLGLTGPPPNPLALACDAALAVDAPTTATVQEVHLVLVHVLCDAVERALPDLEEER
jgi:D-sedoheptulose 7-phosphate isomerase